MKSSDIQWHPNTVTRASREQLNHHKAVIIWFTGLSGSGKSTLANAVEEVLHEAGCRTMVLDGDNVRHGLCGDLGFSLAERTENIRRVGEISKLFVEAGIVVLTAFISPFRDDRERVRRLMEYNDFIEVYCDCPMEICESRDLKDLYRRARNGEITDFTGITSPYEAPLSPELVIYTGKHSLGVAVDQVLAFLQSRHILPNT